MRVSKKRCYFIVITVAIGLLVWHKISSKFQSPEGGNGKAKGRDYVLGEGSKPTVKTLQKPPVPKSNNPVNIFIPSVREPDHYEETQLRTAQGKTPIFIHSPDMDSMISSRVKQHGIWEEDLLTELSSALLKFPDIIFLDIGCNIGVYTLYIADFGIDVIAIDPVMENLKLLSMSVKAGNFKSNVTLIWNAISNEYKTVILRIPKGNIGGAHIVDSIDEKDANGKDEEDRHMEISSVESILLDDLIPLVKRRPVAMKMDIEGHEANALQGASDFFQTFDVKMILMEWVHHKYRDTGQLIVDFLVKRGLFPYKNADMTGFLDPDKFYTWPENVFWIKR